MIWATFSQILEPFRFIRLDDRGHDYLGPCDVFPILDRRVLDARCLRLMQRACIRYYSGSSSIVLAADDSCVAAFPASAP